MDGCFFLRVQGPFWNGLKAKQRGTKITFGGVANLFQTSQVMDQKVGDSCDESLIRDPLVDIIWVGVTH